LDDTNEPVLSATYLTRFSKKLMFLTLQDKENMTLKRKNCTDGIEKKKLPQDP